MDDFYKFGKQFVELSFNLTFDNDLPLLNLEKLFVDYDEGSSTLR